MGLLLGELTDIASLGQCVNYQDSKPHTLTDVIWYHLHVESKKKKRDTNELIYKTEIDSQT